MQEDCKGGPTMKKRVIQERVFGFFSFLSWLWLEGGQRHGRQEWRKTPSFWPAKEVKSLAFFVFFSSFIPPSPAGSRRWVAGEQKVQTSKPQRNPVFPPEEQTVCAELCVGGEILLFFSHFNVSALTHGQAPDKRPQMQF